MRLFRHPALTAMTAVTVALIAVIVAAFALSGPTSSPPTAHTSATETVILFRSAVADLSAAAATENWDAVHRWPTHARALIETGRSAVPLSATTAAAWDEAATAVDAVAQWDRSDDSTVLTSAIVAVSTAADHLAETATAPR